MPRHTVVINTNLELDRWDLIRRVLMTYQSTLDVDEPVTEVVFNADPFRESTALDTLAGLGIVTLRHRPGIRYMNGESLENREALLGSYANTVLTIVSGYGTESTRSLSDFARLSRRCLWDWSDVHANAVRPTPSVHDDVVWPTYPIVLPWYDSTPCLDVRNKIAFE